MSPSTVAETEIPNDIFGFVDESGIEAELRKSPNYGSHNPHPFRAYIDRVVEKAGVPPATETRRLAAVICSEVARLPFVPEDDEKMDDGKTEFEQQVIKTAKRAEGELDSPMVWTSAARKLAQAALDLRKSDPNGDVGRKTQGKQGAWVNDPLPERKAA